MTSITLERTTEFINFRKYSVMTNEEKTILKNSISRKIKRLTTEVNELKEFTKPVAPENAIGRLSRMEAINNKSVAEASLRNCEGKLKNLKQALNDIDTPDFGNCRKCKRPIPFMRLKLMPESSFCVNCAK